LCFKTEGKGGGEGEEQTERRFRGGGEGELAGWLAGAVAGLCLWREELELG